MIVTITKMKSNSLIIIIQFKIVLPRSPPIIIKMKTNNSYYHRGMLIVVKGRSNR